MNTDPTKALEKIEALLEEVELELLALEGKPVPHAKRYIFKVNDVRGVSEKRKITGAEILTLTKFEPPKNFTLSMKHKKHWVPVKLHEEVDLGQPGIERFRANPNDATDGSL